jgi:hypothetical protein
MACRTRILTILRFVSHISFLFFFLKKKITFVMFSFETSLLYRSAGFDLPPLGRCPICALLTRTEVGKQSSPDSLGCIIDHRVYDLKRGRDQNNLVSLQLSLCLHCPSYYGTSSKPHSFWHTFVMKLAPWNGLIRIRKTLSSPDVEVITPSVHGIGS